MTSIANFRPLFLALLLATAAALACLLATGVSASPPVPAANIAAMPTPESWLLVPTLSPDASQADHGAEVYRLVCSACHGDRGQGLTDEWRASWAPADQNCWQSKCHAANHPPEGFVFPRTAPAIVGPSALAKFATAADLQAFLKATMPWYAPGALTDDEYWQLASYLMRANGYGELALGPANAAEVKLAAAGVAHVPAASTVENKRTAPSRGSAAVLVILVVMGAAGIWLLERARRGRPG